MASIKGITLKRVQHFRGTDGSGVNADIYMDGKKIGDAHDGGYGGGLDVDINHEYSAKFKKRVETYYKEHPSSCTGNEWFMEELIALHDYEKDYKRNARKGYPIMVDMKFHARLATLDDILSMLKNDKVIFCVDEKTLEVNLKKHEPVVYTVYRSLDDFIIR